MRFKGITMQLATGEKPSSDIREEEIQWLFEKVSAGESVSVIGVSNIGKSNLIQRLLDPVAQQRFLPSFTRFTFLKVNFHNLPDFDNRSVYSLILEQLEMQDTGDEPGCISAEDLRHITDYHEALLQAGDDDLRIQRFFKLALRIFFREPDRRLVLLFDQFDRLYQRAAGQLFYNMRGLRDTYKYRVSYLVFTNQPLLDIPLVFDQPAGEDAQKEGSEADSTLAAQQDEEAREEFFELLQPHQCYLKPYSFEDGQCLLRQVAERNKITFDETVALPLYQITGGHAGLLRVVYLYLVKSGEKIDPGTDHLQSLSEVESIIQECDRIWASLSESEQDVLEARALGHPVSNLEKTAEAKLTQKGLLNETGIIFSPLLEQYARQMKILLEKPIFLDEKRQLIYVYGKAGKRLSKAEYTFFKKLYDNENMVVSQEEIFQALWPKEEFDAVHSPQSLSTIVYRIRIKLGLPEKSGLLQAMPKQGYILNNKVTGQ
jgi:DNA-binding winged helix-turn-helix (wHTH) protein